MAEAVEQVLDEQVLGEQVFAEPWEAQVFALATALQDRGLFTGEEWAQTLGAEIARDPCAPYYESWLAALERMVVAKGATDGAALLHFRDAWDRAARATPHGRPIELGADERP